MHYHVNHYLCFSPHGLPSQRCEFDFRFIYCGIMWIAEAWVEACVPGTIQLHRYTFIRTYYHSLCGLCPAPIHLSQLVTSLQSSDDCLRHTAWLGLVSGRFDWTLNSLSEQTSLWSISRTSPQYRILSDELQAPLHWWETTDPISLHSRMEYGMVSSIIARNRHDLSSSYTRQVETLAIASISRRSRQSPGQRSINNQASISPTRCNELSSRSHGRLRCRHPA